MKCKYCELELPEHANGCPGSYKDLTDKVTAASFFCSGLADASFSKVGPRMQEASYLLGFKRGSASHVS